MPKYKVTLREIEVYKMTVEADSETEAAYKAYELIETKEGKFKHHDDSDSEFTVYESD